MAAASADASPVSSPAPLRNGDRETVSRAPRPVGDGPVLLSVASRQGNAELPLAGRIGTGTLAVQVNCQGEGTLDVTVTGVALSFPLDCVKGEVSSTYNEVHLKKARGEGAVRITAPAGVRWAVTVER
ncbi:hypothetical protein ABT097_23795 [Streptomyces sp. NPDC002225]|uniref:hypothetical protein n=1 Tax=Streptomyces sp. NPDC002225 TaxID=3154413 RepID=UPI00331D791F